MPELQEVMSPLNELGSTKRKFVWSIEQQKVFDEINCIFENNIVLQVPNINERFIVNVDGSEKSIAEGLSQRNE